MPWYSIDDIIQTLDNAARFHLNNAFGLINRAAAAAPSKFNFATITDTTYAKAEIQPPSFAVSLNPTNETNKVFSDAVNQLYSFYKQYFPGIDRSYVNWISALNSADQFDETQYMPVDLYNRQDQLIDSFRGEVNRYKQRYEYASKGFSLPPGMLFRAIETDIKERSIELKAKSMSRLPQFVEESMQIKKQLYSTCLSLQSSRAYALDAASRLIREAARALENEAQNKIMINQAKQNFISAYSEYIKTVININELNHQLMQTYSNGIQKTLSAALSTLYNAAKNNASLNETAASVAIDAAQGAISSITAIASSSVVGFE